MKTNLLIAATIVLILIAASGFAQVTDIDGKTYKTVEIAGQTWMAENLNVSKFRNGDRIPEAKTDEEWKKAGESKQPAWCYYKNTAIQSDANDGKLYGKLYNWYAVNDSRGLAPKGWHIPSYNELTMLIYFFGELDIAGLKMKSSNGWETENGTNESGFSGLPGGLRSSSGHFSNLGFNTNWWSFTNKSTDAAWTLQIGGTCPPGIVVRSTQDMKYGFSVRCLQDGTSMIKKENKFGLIDAVGKELCSFKYDSIGFFFNDVALMNIGGIKNQKGIFSGGLWGIIDKNGREIIPASFTEISANSNSKPMLYFVTNGKYGFLNKKTGKTVIPAVYDEISYRCDLGEGDFNEDGTLAVRIKDKWGIINSEGKVLIPLIYDEVHTFREELVCVAKGVPSEASKSNEVYEDSKYGFLDRMGNVVIPFKFDEISNSCSFDGGFYEGLAAVNKNNKWGFIDKTGKEVIPFKYDYASSFSEGLASAQINEKYGFIDKIGKEIITFKYDFVSSFSEGLASVRINKKWGFIDKKGKEVIPIIYDNVWSFSKSSAVVKLNGREFYIDKNGNEIKE
ncbi:MAG: WG repeat-containing protein [Bacteroidota bacterium]